MHLNIGTRRGLSTCSSSESSTVNPVAAASKSLDKCAYILNEILENDEAVWDTLKEKMKSKRKPQQQHQQPRKGAPTKKKRPLGGRLKPLPPMSDSSLPSSESISCLNSVGSFAMAMEAAKDGGPSVALHASTPQRTSAPVPCPVPRQGISVQADDSALDPFARERVRSKLFTSPTTNNIRRAPCTADTTVPVQPAETPPNRRSYPLSVHLPPRHPPLGHDLYLGGLSDKENGTIAPQFLLPRQPHQHHSNYHQLDVADRGTAGEKKTHSKKVKKARVNLLDRIDERENGGNPLWEEIKKRRAEKKAECGTGSSHPTTDSRGGYSGPDQYVSECVTKDLLYVKDHIASAQSRASRPMAAQRQHECEPTTGESEYAQSSVADTLRGRHLDDSSQFGIPPVFLTSGSREEATCYDRGKENVGSRSNDQDVGRNWGDKKRSGRDLGGRVHGKLTGGEKSQQATRVTFARKSVPNKKRIAGRSALKKNKGGGDEKVQVVCDITQTEQVARQSGDNCIDIDSDSKDYVIKTSAEGDVKVSASSEDPDVTLTETYKRPEGESASERSKSPTRAHRHSGLETALCSSVAHPSNGLSMAKDSVIVPHGLSHTPGVGPDETSKATQMRALVNRFIESVARADDTDIPELCRKLSSHVHLPQSAAPDQTHPYESSPPDSNKPKASPSKTSRSDVLPMHSENVDLRKKLKEATNRIAELEVQRVRSEVKDLEDSDRAATGPTNLRKKISELESSNAGMRSELGGLSESLRSLQLQTQEVQKENQRLREERGQMMRVLSAVKRDNGQPISTNRSPIKPFTGGVEASKLSQTQHVGQHEQMSAHSNKQAHGTTPDKPLYASPRGQTYSTHNDQTPSDVNNDCVYLRKRAVFLEAFIERRGREICVLQERIRSLENSSSNNRALLSDISRQIQAHGCHLPGAGEKSGSWTEADGSLRKDEGCTWMYQLVRRIEESLKMPKEGSGSEKPKTGDLVKGADCSAKQPPRSGAGFKRPAPSSSSSSSSSQGDRHHQPIGHQRGNGAGFGVEVNAFPPKAPISPQVPSVGVKVAPLCTNVAPLNADVFSRYSITEYFHSYQPNQPITGPAILPQPNQPISGPVAPGKSPSDITQGTYETLSHVAEGSNDLDEDLSVPSSYWGQRLSLPVASGNNRSPKRHHSLAEGSVGAFRPYMPPNNGAQPAVKVDSETQSLVQSAGLVEVENKGREARLSPSSEEQDDEKDLSVSSSYFGQRLSLPPGGVIKSTSDATNPTKPAAANCTDINSRLPVSDIQVPVVNNNEEAGAGNHAGAPAFRSPTVAPSYHDLSGKLPSSKPGKNSGEHCGNRNGDQPSNQDGGQLSNQDGDQPSNHYGDQHSNQYGGQRRNQDCDQLSNRDNVQPSIDSGDQPSNKDIGQAGVRHDGLRDHQSPFHKFASSSSSSSSSYRDTVRRSSRLELGSGDAPVERKLAASLPLPQKRGPPISPHSTGELDRRLKCSRRTGSDVTRVAAGVEQRPSKETPKEAMTGISARAYSGGRFRAPGNTFIDREAKQLSCDEKTDIPHGKSGGETNRTFGYNKRQSAPGTSAPAATSVPAATSAPAAISAPASTVEIDGQPAGGKVCDMTEYRGSLLLETSLSTIHSGKLHDASVCSIESSVGSLSTTVVDSNFQQGLAELDANIARVMASLQGGH